MLPSRCRRARTRSPPLPPGFVTCSAPLVGFDVRADDTPSGGSVLEVRVLVHDLPVAEREQIAAVDLRAGPVGARAGEHPLRHPAVAAHEVLRVTEMRVRPDAEHTRDRLSHALATLVAL